MSYRTLKTVLSVSDSKPRVLDSIFGEIVYISCNHSNTTARIPKNCCILKHNMTYTGILDVMITERVSSLPPAFSTAPGAGCCIRRFQRHTVTRLPEFPANILLTKVRSEHRLEAVTDGPRVKDLHI